MQHSYLSRIQKGIDFIERHLHEEIQPHEVARAAEMSQWHFQRIFKALTNETLKYYIRSRRLSLAMNKLLGGEQRIIDIALESGFESQEAFTRAFKKMFDITPNEFRKLGEKNRFLHKAKFDTLYMQHIHEHILLQPKIVTQPSRTFVGVQTDFYGVDSEKNNFADKLPALWDNFLPRMNQIQARSDNHSCGIIQTHTDTDLLTYYAACEVASSATMPEGMESLTVPAATYAVFTHKGLITRFNNTVNYIYSSWLLQSGYRHTYGPDIEIYGEAFIPDSENSVVYYAIPVATL